MKVNTQRIEVLLPETLSLQEAIQINNAGLRLDGIEEIDHNGMVSFTEQSMTIYKEVLGYECKHMPLSEVEDRAKELQARYLVLAKKYHE